MALPATRLGDKDVFHDCSTPMNAEGSNNVFVNGIPWFLLGMKNTTHIINGSEPCNTSHSANLSSASKTVFVNGIGAGRIKDPFSACTSVAEGSDNVYCG